MFEDASDAADPSIKQSFLIRHSARLDILCSGGRADDRDDRDDPRPRMADRLVAWSPHAIWQTSIVSIYMYLVLTRSLVLGDHHHRRRQVHGHVPAVIHTHRRVRPTPSGGLRDGVHRCSTTNLAPASSKLCDPPPANDGDREPGRAHTLLLLIFDLEIRLVYRDGDGGQSEQQARLDRGDSSGLTGSSTLTPTTPTTPSPPLPPRPAAAAQRGAGPPSPPVLWPGTNQAAASSACK